jgi:hypothetical protein
VVPSTGPRCAVVGYAGADAATVSPLVAELRSRGFEVAEDAQPGEALVAVLPAAGEASTAESVGPELPGLLEPLIPVVFGSRSSLVLADRSQIIVPPAAVATAADRIQAMLRLGGAQLIAINDLRCSALIWGAGGRRPADLLYARQTVEALPVASTAASSGVPDAGVINDFVPACSALQTRMHRWRRRIATGVAAVLTAATVLATVAKFAADSAAAAAKSQAGAATSSRLSGIADGMLMAKPAPDQVWLLAGAAMAASSSPEAVDTARLVREAVPDHRTIALTTTPSGLTATDAGTIVIRNADGSIDVRDRDGQVRRSWPAGTGADGVAVSPDGGRLAAASAGSLVVTTAGATDFPVTEDRMVPLTESATALT